MEQNIKILIADDEQDIIDILEYNLRKEGFLVCTAGNGKEAIAVAIKENPDLIVLDIMMPKLDGVETCKELREMPQFKSTLIVFLTARGEDYSQIAGFEVGADDYITKPIRPRVFIARVNALLKRLNKNESGTSEVILLGDLKINMEKRVVSKGNENISLPKKEFELLLLLASKPGKIFTRDEIYSRVWGDDLIVGERTLDVHIRKLREKIGESNIKTIKGIGYGIDL